MTKNDTIKQAETTKKPWYKRKHIMLPLITIVAISWAISKETEEREEATPKTEAVAKETKEVKEDTFESRMKEIYVGRMTNAYKEVGLEYPGDDSQEENYVKVRNEHFQTTNPEEIDSRFRTESEIKEITDRERAASPDGKTESERELDEELKRIDDEYKMSNVSPRDKRLFEEAGVTDAKSFIDWRSQKIRTAINNNDSVNMEIYSSPQYLLDSEQAEIDDIVKQLQKTGTIK